MQIHFSYHNFDGNKCDGRLETYVSEKKLKRLSRLLGRGDFDLADLDIRAEYMAHHNAFSVRLNLKIAKHILVAEKASHKLTKAFNLALKKIIAQARKLEDIRRRK